jgi:site-specific recombinase XerD
VSPAGENPKNISSSEVWAVSSKPKLLDQVRSAIRTRHYSRRTEMAYVFWVRRFVIFHRMRHPAEMGEAEVAEFLTSLAVRNKVSASTQNQALAAILFLYKRVLNQELEWMEGIVRAKMPQRLPLVLGREEVQAVLGQLQGIHRLMGTLLYGSGLRVRERLRLRVRDIDVGQNLRDVQDS